MKKSTSVSILLLAFGLLLIAGATGCTAVEKLTTQPETQQSALLEETVTVENATQLAERARQELSYDEYRLIQAYVGRVHPHLPAGSLPPGISLRTMLESQRDFEAVASRQQPAEQPADTPPASSAAAPSQSQPRRTQPPASTPASGTAAGTQTQAAQPVDVPPPAAPAAPIAPAAPAAPAPPATAVVTSGTTVTVRLAKAVSSKTNREGDSFEAILDEPLVVDGRVLAPEGTRLMGRLTNVKASGRVEGRATMSLALTELQFAEEAFPIRSNRLDFEAKGTGKDDAKKIGIGAGIGAAIGAIAGGGKGAAIGGAIGAGAGTGAVLATAGDEVEFGVEQLFSFQLTRDLELPVRR